MAAAARVGREDQAVALTPDEVAQRISSPVFRGGVFYPECATVHPGLLVRALRRAALDAGVTLHEETPVTALRAGSPNELETPGGILRAPEVVLATNAALTGWSPASRNLTNFGSYVVLTEPAPELLAEIGWTGGEAVVDGRMFLHYFRTTNDGRVLMGSGSGPIGFGGRIDDRFSRDVPTAARAEAGLRRLLPGLAGVRVERAWGGPIDVSADHLPFFRTKPGTRIHYGAGYSGHGVGPAWLGGRILASLALGADDEWTRSPLATRARAAPAAGAAPPLGRGSRPLGDHGLRGGRGGGTAPGARREGRSRPAAAARDGARHPLAAGSTLGRCRSCYATSGRGTGSRTSPRCCRPRRGRSSSTGSRRRAAAHRGGQLRPRRPRAADGRRRGGDRARRPARGRRALGPRAQRARLGALRRGRARPRQRDLRGDRDLQPAQRERDARGGDRAGGGDPRCGRRDAGDGDDLVLVRLPLRRARRSRRRGRARSAVRRPRGGRPRRHHRRRDAVRGGALVEQARAAGFHGHNTRNTGYANCLAALEAGAHVLDASVGGLGGCPFSPRATGNVATEDLVYLLEGEGIETGVDLDALVGVSRWLEEVLGRTLEGYVYRAGTWPP